MIYGGMNSAKRIRYSKLFADANRRRILDFAMPWDSAGSLGGGIVVNTVFGPFADENAAVCLQVAN
jgi:hypothetical protein